MLQVPGDILLTSLTQVGKTRVMIKGINACIMLGKLVIITMDNFKDHLEQTMSRIKLEIDYPDTVFIETSDKCIDGTNDKKWIDDYSRAISSRKPAIIFALNNKNRVKQILKFLQIITRQYQIDLVIFHDEGDLVIKDTCSEFSEKQPRVHQEWTRVQQIIKDNPSSQLCRIFITASPETCCVVYSIKECRIYNIEPCSEYTSPMDIEWAHNSELHEECKRITNLKGSLLYKTSLECFDHEKILEQLMIEIPWAVIHTYNGQKTLLYIPDTYTTIFEKISLEQSKNNPRICIMPNNIPIRKLYSIFEQEQVSLVITIGGVLLSRGISFVSESGQFCALGMYYIVSKDTHCTGMLQSIGRLCGNVRPGIKRRLLSEEKVFQNYKLFIETQSSFLKNIQDDSKTSWNSFESVVLPRSVSRVLKRKKYGFGTVVAE